MKNYLYAVAVCEGSDIWLVLRVKHNPQSGFYVLVPHPKRKWDAHLSYHLSGRQHLKTHGRQPLPAQQCQPLTAFRGTKHLGNFRVGDVGVICDPVKFTKVMEVQAEKLKVRDAVVAIDLVEPGCTPRPPQDLMLDDVVEEKVFDETNPHIVIRIGTLSGPMQAPQTPSTPSILSTPSGVARSRQMPSIGV